MKNIHSIKSAVSIVVAVAFVTSGCATVRTHPDFKDRHAHMKKLAVLPPDTLAYEVTFNAGNKPLADLQDLASAKSDEGLREILTGKGYEVVDVNISQKDLDSDPALKEAVFNIRTLYAQAVEDIGKNKKPSFTYDVGSSPNYFAEKHEVHAIVLTRQVAVRLSDGVTAAQALSTAASVATVLLTGVAIGGGMKDKYTLTSEIAVVDADSGDILWYHLGKTNENFTKKEDTKVIPKHLKSIVGPFPDSKFKAADNRSPKK